MNTNRIKSIAKIAALFGAFFLMNACNQNGYDEQISMSPVDVDTHFESVVDEALVSNHQNDVIPNQIKQGLKIIKSANAKYKVKDVKKATAKIKQMATAHEAYISDLRYQNTLYQIENRFTIKVPQAHFDTMMDSIGSIAEFVEYENITTKDVTEEYVDVQTRLNTKKEVKVRYEEILRKKAKTIDEILATEDKLRLIQEEIEAAEGKLKFLSNKVAYSTIQVELYETVAYVEEPISYTKTFADKSKNGFANGWSAIEAVVLIAINIWPVFLIGFILWIVLRKQWKR